MLKLNPMWFFRKKTLEERRFFQGFVDWHSHLLPGVDDGIQSLDETLQILAEYERIGISEVWLTPHIMEDIPNTTSELRARFAELQEAYKGSVVLHLAAENMIDALFEERLRADDLLPLGPEGRHLLVETSYFNPPMGFRDILREIQSCGYHPVLAHPERYIYITMEELQELKEMGVYFQLNQFSLLGMYGREAQKRAKALSKMGLYDYAGTDLHRLKTLTSALKKSL